MKRRTIKKQYLVNDAENLELKRKAKKAGLKEAALIRFLIMGYEPKEKPGENLNEFIKAIVKLSNELETIVIQNKISGNFDNAALERELKKLHKLEFELEEEFLNHRKVD